MPNLVYKNNSSYNPHNPKIFQMVVFIQRHDHVISTFYENSFNEMLSLSRTIQRK
jgi:hypothetical protein